MGLLDPTSYLAANPTTVDPTALDGLLAGQQAVQALPATNVPPNPQAAIPGLLQTPTQAVQSYAKQHPAIAALDTLGAMLQQMGGSPGAIEANRSMLAARAQEGLGLAQQKAKFQALIQMRNSLPASEVPTFDADPLAYADQMVKNRALQKLAGGESLAGAQGVGATAPLLGIDPKSGVPFSQVPGAGGFTPQGRLGGDFSAGAGGIVSGRTGGFTGVSAPQVYNAGQGIAGFTPQAAGQPGPAAPPAPQTPAPVPAAPGAAGSANMAGLVNAQGRLDPLAFFQQFTGPHEGGFNPSDINGSPTNFGINQKANPGVNVKNLTPQAAAQIFANKYFAQSGAANLPPALAAVHADTSFINPIKAKQFLNQSGGDPAKYMALRQAWMQKLVQTNPAAAKYAQAWSNRNADLSQLAGQLQGQPAQGAQGQAAASPAGLAPQATPGLQTLIAPRQPRVLAPEEAQAHGFGPGVTVQNPDGSFKNTPAPKDDLERVSSLQSTTTGLQALLREQRNFLGHNYKLGTSPLYANPEVHGVGLNPVASVMEGVNPDFQAMEGSAAKQLFMVKPANAGARILQSEIPYWEVQTQSPAKTGDVNQAIMHTTAQNLQQAQQQSDFYNRYVYMHGNLNGADAAWNEAQNAKPPSAAQPRGATTAAAAPAAAIAYLHQHPELATAFDAKYGPGASQAALGR
jgi:hypothetical protein